MTRPELLACGQHLRAILTDLDADHIEITSGDERLIYERGEGYRIEVNGRTIADVPEAAFEDRWEAVA